MLGMIPWLLQIPFRLSGHRFTTAVVLIAWENILPHPPADITSETSFGCLLQFLERSCEPRLVHEKSPYLVSSASASCSSSSQRDEGRYRWSSETFWAPGCVWRACLSLSQGTVGVSGRRKSHGQRCSSSHIHAADVIYSLPAIQKLWSGSGWRREHNNIWTTVSVRHSRISNRQLLKLKPKHNEVKSHRNNAKKRNFHVSNEIRLFVGVTTSEHSCSCPKLEEEFI